ncbi:MAG: TIGR04190 family B12-binding domain/radical SAM domain protein [Dethiobacter sp.]|jgi:B12-binding domain/radical SAM domain protein|nr:MAG: TIGR04190 family B12-binding domain/radical SAM domain protein [Dethiobacter sp.]
MYPVGVTSIASYLEERGFRTQIINLAYKMLADPAYDVERTISRTRARFFALDLHWLPHVHGSIEIAHLVKKHHPDSVIIMGGMTASYYHQELMKYSSVDYVLRGDSVEEPCYRLLNCLTKGLHLKEVPNLTFRDGDGRVVENPLSHVPSCLDDVDVPAYRYLISSVFKNGSFLNCLPYQGWLEYPMTLLLTSRGCSMNCVICGGSSSAYQRICNRKTPAFRSPARLREDVRTITLFSRAPIFVIHDLRQGGRKYAEEFLDGLAAEKVPNEFIFELFQPASDEYFKRLNSSVSRYSLQLSIESHVQKIRENGGGKFSHSSNKEIINTMRKALRNGCQKIDLFFIIGLPGQKYADALGCVEFSRRIIMQLREEFGAAANIVPYAAPYAPFLDPGSPIYEDPDRYGYRILWKELDDYRTALLAPSWKYMLNYETQWMSRHELVRATYATARKFNALKLELEIIDAKTFLSVKKALEKSEKIIELVDEITREELGELPGGLFPLPAARKVLEILHGRAEMEETGYALCGSKELHWPVKARFGGLFSFFKLGLQLLSGAGTDERISPPGKNCSQ